MASPASPTRQRVLLLFLLLLLGCGFLTTSLVSDYSAVHSIRAGIIHTELPLTSDNVYSEIQKDLVRPILISSIMARDTCLRDWVLAGEIARADRALYRAKQAGRNSLCEETA